MADIATKNKLYILPGFSSIPRTSKIESDREKLLKDFEDFNNFEQSRELKEFYTLQEYISSKEFAVLQDEIEKEKKEENGKIALYGEQKKSAVFKKYFKFRESPRLKRYQAFESSKELADYLELEKLVTSAAFTEKRNKSQNVLEGLKAKENELKALKKSSESEKYEELKAEVSSAGYQKALEAAGNELKDVNAKLDQYNQLKKSRPFKEYFKFGQSQRYRDFVSFSGSKQLADYLELEKYLQSDAHKSRLAEISKKENSEAEKKKQYEEFRNSKKYKWYTGLRESNVFNELRKWEAVFVDEFDGNKLDHDRWMTRYYWGEKLIDDAYAHESDFAFPTDGNNVGVNKGIMKIELRKEKHNGKVWNPPFGFVPKDFEYTTGIVGMQKKHWLRYGKIEAKIRVNFAKPAQYNFWMTTGKMLPHIDIMKLDKKKSNVTTSVYWGEMAPGKSPEHRLVDNKGADASRDFFIYTLEWTKDKLVWKINGLVVNEQTQGVPQEEMSVVFSLNLMNKPNDSKLPLSMEVDWIRCYRQA
ncbi:MAG: family 16 glycosylhydrolase [Bacteroidales bacterium]|nr:family 16 glycosylhydrolase [Bacteroidales bacterium]